MEAILYCLIYYFTGKFWSNTLERIIIEDIDIRGFLTTFEKRLHIFLWPISLGIFLRRYFQILWRNKND